MTLKSVIAAAAFTMSCLGAFASTANLPHEPQSSHMMLLGVGMMGVIVWRRLKSGNA
ncbi:PEP-CTERM sorting domain-containing protein [Rhodoferax sp. U2-2l]|uniref:PEP-CTERM sorting domain-containing protein n=1 Tax=Rhodoferax sp. U2-2l TaxID=2884000 RepID=UPI001D0A0472|nr:PEP-CTERM sorting domain-containing protein [Rhodoferax sp. U2-2l]MCB8746908.1 PEP-CTERM sorting domain-containing protein [Rhodoferax sp. U2-2l]